MDTQKSLTKSERIAKKIADLQAQLDENKARERKQVKADARRQVERVIKRSGLLALVRAGKVTVEQLEIEFKALAVKTRGEDPVPETHSPADHEQPVAGEPEEKKRNKFWGN